MVKLLPCDHEVTGSSPGNSLLQKCRERLRTIDPKWSDPSPDPAQAGATCTGLPPTYGRMESLKLKSFHGIVKVSGIVLCVAGVAVLALYQGPELKSIIHHPLFHHTSRVDIHPSRSWILGILLQSFATLMFALWTVFQGPLLEEYPSMLLNMTLQIVFATIQSFLMALVMERDISRWKLRLDVGLVAIIYSGVVVSAFSDYLVIWVIDKRGLVFLAMAVPLTFVITIVLSLLIGEAVTLGSVISGALMIGGLYNVLWGKRIEQVALSKQGGIEANAASFDLEEQESGAPVPLTRDSIKRCKRED